MLEIKDLTRRYITRTAVDDFSLTLESGRTYALLGPNGSGKTTLMKMIAGLTLPNSGSIRLDGTPIGPASKAHIAYMPTENFFYPYMTISDAGRYYRDFFKDFDPDAFNLYLDRMQLRKQDPIRKLSSGMSAKLRLALTLSRNASLLMLDEPLNGVDIITRDQVIEAIRNARNETRTLLISSHMVDELEPLLDNAIFMRNGKLALSGSVSDLTQQGSLTDLYRRIYAGTETEEKVC